jgi:hypothetical protein
VAIVVEALTVGARDCRDGALKLVGEEDAEVASTAAGPVELENVGGIVGSVVAAKDEAAFAVIVVGAGRWED